MNRLASETSPYLIQHAENPVDWYPWGSEAFAAARAQDKPIFLSVGYSSCHWCHVMAHESFESERVSQILNEHYVSIKVDREERPDVDRIYMSAVQAMTGSGGWPMSVFCTPEGVPFYGGTYFPPERRHGMAAFSDVLLAIAAAWRERRQDLLEGSEKVRSAIEANTAWPAGNGAELSEEDALEQAFDRIADRFDPEHGGWGSAPKFPQPMALEFLLRYHHRTGRSDALAMVERTLQAMARGGMYDQLGGGFHRYAVDSRWLVPHFEKMLHDNALLARVYLHAWQVTGRPLYRAVAEETLDYVAREMVGPHGGFYSAQDADSEGGEGAFYVWTADEVRETLGVEARAFVDAYGVSKAGNFEGKNILAYVGSLEQRPALAGARRTLLQARERRAPPGRDAKVLVSWNGLTLAAFAEAARVLDREDYRAIAVRNGTFLTTELLDGGRLYHVWTDGAPKLNAYLEDYTHLAEGLIELYQTTHDARWYGAAVRLVDTMGERFAAPVGYYDTSDDHEALITRPRELQDNAVPSGNAMAALVLARLAAVRLEPAYRETATRTVSAMRPLLSQYPLGFAQWLIALEQLTGENVSVAIVGVPGSADVEAMLTVIRADYRPNLVSAVGRSDSPGVPLLRYRDQVAGSVTAHVCVGSVCQPPVTDTDALRDTLGGGARLGSRMGWLAGRA